MRGSTGHMTSEEVTPKQVTACLSFLLVAFGGKLCFQDMQLAGVPLKKIREAGGWRSNAIFRYLDECELEASVALEAAITDDNTYDFID